jgi:F-type H+-transporting ATPase subunit b
MKRFFGTILFAWIAVAVCSPAWTQEKAEPAKTPQGQEEAAKASESGKAVESGKAAELKSGAKEAEGKEPEPTPEEKEKAEKQERSDLIFKSINFVILFGLIIYFLAKPARDFFSARTAAIGKGMADAKAAREDAEKRLAEVEQKLANLNNEIARLRTEAAKEDAVQAERMRQATEAEGAKILAAAEAEIDVKTRTARLELKAYAAKLAVDLAEERIKGRMTPDVQGRLLQSYVNDLTDVATERGKN